MRKLMTLIIAAALLFALAPAGIAQANAADKWLDTTLLDKGAITITYNVKAKVDTKLMVRKGKESYTYDLTSKTENFALQLGNGEYQVFVLELANGKAYKAVKQGKVKLNLKDDAAIYLNAIQNVSWAKENAAIKKATELAKGKKTDEEKVKAIYEYITENVAYDAKLAASAPNTYLPNTDKTFTTNKGMCYDYASLFAAMLRSLDIPTKLVMGDAEDVTVYHAWNEVYLNGEWVVVDTTVDAGAKNKPANWKKDAGKYKGAKYF